MAVLTAKHFGDIRSHAADSDIMAFEKAGRKLMKNGPFFSEMKFFVKFVAIVRNTGIVWVHRIQQYGAHWSRTIYKWSKPF